MGLYELYLATGSRSLAIKYALEPCFGLRALRYGIWAQFADATAVENVKYRFVVGGTPPVLKRIRTLKQDLVLKRQKYSRPLCVIVTNQIDDIHEANRILQKVGELDPTTLGRLKVVGLRLKWKHSGADPLEWGKFLPCGGKS
jgi:hypothetical protein